MSSGLGFRGWEGERKQDAFKTHNLFLNGTEGKDTYIKNLSEKEVFGAYVQLVQGRTGVPLFSQTGVSACGPLRGVAISTSPLSSYFQLQGHSILGRLQITFEKFGALFLSVTPLHTSHGLFPTSAVL